MRKSFQCVLEKIGTRPTRVIARMPFAPAEAWPQARFPANTARVKGTIRSGGRSGAAFAFDRGYVVKADGDYLLAITQKMLAGARVRPGALVELTIEPDLKGQPVPLPPELSRLLKSDRAMLRWFETLTEGMRRWITGNISEPKSAEVRRRRAEQWAERLMLMMEGEQEPPPILRAAFREHPRAEAGWKLVSLSQRRMHLMTIFSARSPEARAKRVEVAIEQALRAAERGKRTPVRMNEEE